MSLRDGHVDVLKKDAALKCRIGDSLFDIYGQAAIGSSCRNSGQLDFLSLVRCKRTGFETLGKTPDGSREIGERYPQE